jgi:alpha-tubulin suppressor-like RCC1 family protein
MTQRTLVPGARSRLFYTGNSEFNIKEVILPNPNERIVHVASGYELALIVTESGKVYTTGNKDYYKTNVPATYTAPQPLLGFAGKHVIETASGYTHSIFLVSESNTLAVYGLGDNSMGQLNFDNEGGRATEPFKYKYFDGKKIAKVRAGYYHSIVLTTDGKVHYSGNNKHKLNLSALEKHFIVEAFGGYEFSAFISRQGDIFVALLTQGGNVTTQEITRWDIPKNGKFISGAGGYYHALFLTDTGDVWSVGQSMYGKLGRGSETGGMAQVQRIKNVKSVSAGGYHSIMSTEEGFAYGCGHGSFGQFGNGLRDQFEYPTKMECEPDKTAFIYEVIACGWGSYLLESKIYFYNSNEKILRDCLGNHTTSYLKNYSCKRIVRIYLQMY